MATLSGTTPNFRKKQVRPPRSIPSIHSIGGYRLLSKIGSGGMSDVYLAYDEAHERPIAIKILPEELAKIPTNIDRFKREAEMGMLLDHPCIVKCFEAGEDEITGRHYLVMEYVKGFSGLTRLEQQGPFPVSEATHVVLDIARGLEELHHKNYVHRDVKPGNILIDETGKARLADLGVAKLLTAATELTSIDQGIGTPFYMPWEQTLNASLVDQRSDLFALGATYYHLITGRVPYPGKNVAEVSRAKDDGKFKPARAINPKLPKAVDEILLKMLARMPADRFQSATQLIEVLRISGLVDDTTAAGPMAKTDQPQAVTEPDLRAGKRKRAVKPDFWVVQYKLPNGRVRKLKDTGHNVKVWFEEGILPDDFYLGRPGDTKLKHFRKVAPFKDLARRPKPSDSAKTDPGRGPSANRG
jgi:eukaryotic-like serine/threonine-protein kinase